MFEKYKEMQEKRTHFGMSKKEYYKILFMALIALGCLIFIALKWGSLTGQKEGTEIELPQEEIPRGVEVGPKRAGDPDAIKKFEEIKKQRFKEREEASEPEKVELPEIPKPPEPFKPDPNIWKQVSDSTPDQIEWPVVLYALHKLNSMTPEEIDKAVEEDGDIPFEDFTENPGNFRGKFVEVKGTLLTLDDWVLEPNRSGINQYWDGLIYNQQYRNYRRVYFFIFDKDKEWLTQQEARARDLTCNGDLVNIKGIFIKLYTNTTEGGAKMTYPFIIARKLEETRNITVSEQYPWSMLTAVGILFAAIFLIFFIAMRRDIKIDEKYTQSRIKKKSKLVNNEVARQFSRKHRDEPDKGESGIEESGRDSGNTEKPSESGIEENEDKG